MRTDPKLSDPAVYGGRMVRAYGDVKELGVERFRSDLNTMDGASQSGHETDNLFYNLRFGREFLELSGVSGIDHDGDGRTVAVWDPDRNGLPDLAVVNGNTPMLRFYENRLDRLGNRVLAVRLVGGARPGREASWSNRDGIGARVMVRTGGRKLLRERRAGEGLGAQSSGVLLFGLGAADRVDALEVVWPSGRAQRVDGLPAGLLVTVHEDTELGIRTELLGPDEGGAGVR